MYTVGCGCPLQPPPDQGCFIPASHADHLTSFKNADAQASG